MKKIFLSIIAIGLFTFFLKAESVSAVQGAITTSDSEGNVIESKLDTANSDSKSRTVVYHATGHWTYFSSLYDWGRKKSGSSNHYSFQYARHGSKAKVGNNVDTGRGALKTWSYAKAYGNKNDTFSCWYNPTDWYRF